MAKNKNKQKKAPTKLYFLNGKSVGCILDHTVNNLGMEDISKPKELTFINMSELIDKKVKFYTKTQHMDKREVVKSMIANGLAPVMDDIAKSGPKGKKLAKEIEKYQTPKAPAKAKGKTPKKVKA